MSLEGMSLEASFLGWDLGIWAFVAAACLVAGVVRGFTGFGFPLIVVTATSLVVAPVEVVPIALLLDVLASVRMLPSVRADIDRRGALIMGDRGRPRDPGRGLAAGLDRCRDHAAGDRHRRPGRRRLHRARPVSFPPSRNGPARKYRRRCRAAVRHHGHAGAAGHPALPVLAPARRDLCARPR